MKWEEKRLDDLGLVARGRSRHRPARRSPLSNRDHRTTDRSSSERHRALGLTVVCIEQDTGRNRARLIDFNDSPVSIRPNWGISVKHADLYLT